MAWADATKHCERKGARRPKGRGGLLLRHEITLDQTDPLRVTGKVSWGPRSQERVPCDSIQKDGTAELEYEISQGNLSNPHQFNLELNGSGVTVGVRADDQVSATRLGPDGVTLGSFAYAGFVKRLNA